MWLEEKTENHIYYYCLFVPRKQTDAEVWFWLRLFLWHSANWHFISSEDENFFFLWKKPRNLPQSLSTSLFNKIIIIKKNNHAIYLELHCCFSKINYAFYLLARRSLWRQRRGRRWLNWAHYPREPNAPTWQWTRTKKLSAMLFRCLEPSEFAIWVCGYFLASNQYNFWDS